MIALEEKPQGSLTLYRASIRLELFENLSNLPEDVPFGLIVEGDLNSLDWKSEFIKWQRAGADWFLGSGANALALQSLWDEANDELADENSDMRLSGWEANLSEALTSAKEAYSGNYDEPVTTWVVLLQL